MFGAVEHRQLAVDLEDPGLHLVDPADEGGGQEGAGRAAAHQAAVLEGVQPVAVGRRDVQIVQGGQHRFAQPPHQVHHAQLILDVQVVGGLVQDQAGGLLGQGPGQDHPLLLPTRKGGKDPLFKPGQPHGRQRLRRDLPVLEGIPLQGLLVRGAAQPHHLLYGKVKGIGVVLGHHR